MTWSGGRLAPSGRQRLRYHVSIDGHDGGGVREHSALEPALQGGEGRGPARRDRVCRPGVAKVGDVGNAEARGDVWAMRIAVGGNEVATTASHRASRRPSESGPHRERVPHHLRVGE